MDTEKQPSAPLNTLYRTIGRVFAGIGLATIIGLLAWGWYGSHDVAVSRAKLIVRLKKDSTYWHNEAVRYHLLSDTLTTQAKDAQNYAGQWRDRYNQQVAASDQQTDAMSDLQKELALKKRLLENRTLAPAYANAPVPPAVIADASLKTANREAIGQTKFDSLSKSASTITGENDRLKKDLDRAKINKEKVSLYAQKKVYQLSQKKYFLGIGRPKAERAVADSIAEYESDLEKYKNNKH